MVRTTILAELYCPIEEKADQRWQSSSSCIHGRVMQYHLAASCPGLMVQLLFRPDLPKDRLQVRGLSDLSHQSVQSVRFFRTLITD